MERGNPEKGWGRHMRSVVRGAYRSRCVFRSRETVQKAVCTGAKWHSLLFVQSSPFAENAEQHCDAIAWCTSTRRDGWIFNRPLEKLLHRAYCPHTGPSGRR